jgi:hypothetical protein
MKTATQILCTGPEPYTGRDGDEHPEWVVCATDVEDEPVGRVYSVRKSLDFARRLGVVRSQCPELGRDPCDSGCAHTAGQVGLRQIQITKED